MAPSAVISSSSSPAEGSAVSEDTETLVQHLPSVRVLGDQEGLRRLIRGSLGQQATDSSEEDEETVVQSVVPPAVRRLLISMFVVFLVAVVFDLIEVHLIQPLDEANEL